MFQIYISQAISDASEMFEIYVFNLFLTHQKCFKFISLSICLFLTRQKCFILVCFSLFLNLSVVTTSLVVLNLHILCTSILSIKDL